MQINVTDQMISQFLSGVFIIFALIFVGSVLSILFKAMSRKFAFTRLALVLALTPLCMVGFLDRSSTATLYLFSMISILLGITIDGINHLLMPKEQPQRAAEPEVAQSSVTEESPDVIVWEKAE